MPHLVVLGHLYIWKESFYFMTYFLLCQCLFFCLAVCLLHAKAYMYGSPLKGFSSLPSPDFTTMLHAGRRLATDAHLTARESLTSSANFGIHFLHCTFRQFHSHGKMGVYVVVVRTNPSYIAKLIFNLVKNCTVSLYKRVIGQRDSGSRKYIAEK